MQMLKLKYQEDINQLVIKSHTAEENYRSMFLYNKRSQKVLKTPTKEFLTKT